MNFDSFVEALKFLLIVLEVGFFYYRHKKEKALIAVLEKHNQNLELEKSDKTEKP